MLSHEPRNPVKSKIDQMKLMQKVPCAPGEVGEKWEKREKCGRSMGGWEGNESNSQPTL